MKGECRKKQFTQRLNISSDRCLDRVIELGATIFYEVGKLVPSDPMQHRSFSVLSAVFMACPDQA